MADISKITVLDGTQYDIKDGSAISNITRSGTTFTATRRNGTSFTFTQQDNNTTYSLSADGSNVKLTPSSGSATTASLNTLINGLGEGTSESQGTDYLVSQYAGGGTSTTTYHRRPVSKVVNKTVVDTALGKGSDTTKYYRNDGTWAVPPDTKYTAATAAPGDISSSAGTTGSSTNYARQDHTHKIAVSNSAPTLAWNTTSTIGSVAGVNLQAKLPANPNTDTLVSQTNSTANSDLRVLLSLSANDTTETKGSYKSTNFKANPSTGKFRATSFNVADKVTAQYNTTTEALDFIFS